MRLPCSDQTINLPPMSEEHISAEIPPQIVRDVAGADPTLGDYRSRFPEAQPELDETISELLEESDELAARFAQGLTAALWAMYSEHLGQELPLIEQESIGRFLPVSRKLLEGLFANRDDEEFDPEWLADLPKGAQPHVMGFLIGALRAARFNLEKESIFETAVLLFAIAGALEGAATKIRKTDTDDPD